MAYPEGPLLREGGGNHIGAKHRLGEGAGVDAPAAGGGPGPSPETFLKKWMQMMHYEPIFCVIRADFSSKIVCNFCLQSSYIRDAGELTPQL